MAGTSNSAIAPMEQIIEKDGIREFSLSRESIINFIFRYESLVDDSNKLKAPDWLNLEKIAIRTKLSKVVVLYVLNKFFRELREFHDFLNGRLENWSPEKRYIYDKILVCLRRLYEIAPIFDYQRAEKNIDILHLLLSRHYYWPHITTQLALLVFVTDRNDPNIKERAYILQKNLRMLCTCSAYAFHNARNKLNISKEGKLKKVSV